MIDLLIRGGEVIDPASGRREVCDIAVSGGKVAAIAADLQADEGTNVVDAGGHYVVPGSENDEEEQK